MSADATEGVIETRTGKVWLADGIIQIQYVAGAELEVKDAEEDLQIMARLAGEQKRPSLADISRLKSVSGNARSTYAGPKAAIC